MWKRTDVFDQIVMTAFDGLDDDAQQDLQTVTDFFEEKWEEAENFIANGGEINKFADASAVEDLQARHEQQIRELKEEHANAITEMERRTTSKIDKLAEAMLQMANERQSERRTRKSPRRRVREQQDSDESSSEEEEPTPPPRPRTRPKKKAKRTAAPSAPAKPTPRSGKVYVPGEPFERGMVYKHDASEDAKECYYNARTRFMNHGTVEGIKERLDGYAAIKKRVDEGGRYPRHLTEAKLTANTAKYEKLLAEAEGADKE